ncbi:hypothetical protein HY638_00230 [Candidatus Woesearchaeota archaeon]|nr:hypothetical protein [Candidatus Woesearchaeota archaeon]
MKKRLDRKGSIAVSMVLELAMDLIMGALVLLVGLAYVNTIIDNSFYDKIYLSRDLAITINTIYTAPGNVDYTYFKDNIDLSKYTFTLKQGQIGVVGGKEGELALYYPFGYSTLVPVEDSLVKNPYKLEIEKSDKVKIESP